MEFCGGHTHTIFRRFMLAQLLPPSIEPRAWPRAGSFCVLLMGRVDDCTTLAERPEVILDELGDALRVPGSSIVAAGAGIAVPVPRAAHVRRGFERQHFEPIARAGDTEHAALRSPRQHERIQNGFDR